MSSTVTVIAGAAAVLLLYVIAVYNRLVRLRNGVENAFSSIDVQLKQRCDLIPKVVDAMRAYMGHERGTLDELTALRERASASGATADERLKLDSQMSGLLRGLIVRAEAYPELKANETVTMLQRSLNEVEAQIAAARRTFNAAATSFNTAVETFPANLLAGLFGFSRRPLFEAAADDRAVPGVRV
ncbi:MAG: LemA family protein [Vicinamibacterales bacterium]